MKISNAFPSKYLKSSDLQDQNVTVKISHVELDDVGGDEKKPVVYFVGKQKGVVLNKTNSKIISTAYGDDTENWRNQSIILFPAMVEFKGDMVEAIRCRVPKQAPPSGLPQEAPRGHAVHTPLPPAAPIHNKFNPPESNSDMDDDIPF